MCSTRRNRWNNKNNSYNNKKKFSSWNSFIYNYFIFLRPILTLNKNNGLLNFLVCKQLLVILSTIWRQDRFIVEFYQVLACRKGSTSTSKTLLTDAGLSWSQKASCFFARQVTSARKVQSLVSNFRMTQIDIFSTLLVINRKRNK